MEKEEKLKELKDSGCRWGDMAAQCLALSPGSKKVLGLISCLQPSCVEFVCSAGVCVGSFPVLKLPHTVQKHASEVNRIDEGVRTNGVLFQCGDKLLTCPECHPDFSL